MTFVINLSDNFEYVVIYTDFLVTQDAYLMICMIVFTFNTRV